MSCLVIDAEEGAVHLAGIGGEVKADGEMAAHLLDGQLGLDAENGADGAGHAEIGDVGGPVFEELFVGGLDVGMGAEDGGDAAVEGIGEAFLLAGGLGVEIDEGDFGKPLGEDGVGGVEGIVEGHIADHESGCEGFGYDPLFIPDGFDRSFAEMTPDEKNAVSHRGRAVRKLAEFLQSREAGHGGK